VLACPDVCYDTFYRAALLPLVMDETDRYRRFCQGMLDAFAQSPAWNRKIKLELLREEAEALIGAPGKEKGIARSEKSAT